MIVETRSFYRGKQKSTGLEILIFGMREATQMKGGLPFTTTLFIATDVDGEIVQAYADDVQLNWRYDTEQDEWKDLNLKLDE